MKIIILSTILLFCILPVANANNGNIKIKFISELVTLIKVDENNYEIGEKLLSKAKKLNVENSAIKPLINGKELIDIGLTPSPQFKHILDKLYQTQLEKDITSKDEAIKYLKLYTSSNTTTG